MRLRALGWISLMLLAGLMSCEPTVVNSTPISPAPTVTPTPTPSPTPTPGPLAVAPNSLTFNSIGLAQPLSVTDPGFTGTYTISGCAGIATFGSVKSGTLSVTSAAAGSCTLIVGDAFSHSASIAVSVTTLSVPVL